MSKHPEKGGGGENRIWDYENELNCNHDLLNVLCGKKNFYVLHWYF